VEVWRVDGVAASFRMISHKVSLLHFAMSGNPTNQELTQRCDINAQCASNNENSSPTLNPYPRTT
jgi:hypothetical protein